MKVTKILFLLCLFGMIGMEANAFDFVENGIYYNVTSFNDYTCEVTYKTNISGTSRTATWYTGSITIPEAVTYNGHNYTITSIGEYAFYEAQNLTKIIFPSTITTIEDYAFFECCSLTNVEIPDNVTIIGEEAFSGCYTLASVIIGNSVTTIGDCAFAQNALTNVVFGKSVQTIGREAFAYNERLKSITLPSSVTTIEEFAFSDCPLTDITLLGTIVPTIINGAFSGYQNITLHVPEGSKASYLTADYWKEFNITEWLYDFKAIDAEGNTIGMKLDYNNEGNDTIMLVDTYQSLNVPQNIQLKKISYARNYGNTSWQSLYVPFEIPVTAELLEEFELAYINAARQYDYDDDGTIDELTIEIFKVKSGTLRANHPYLIRAKETGVKTITVNEATLYATAANQVDCSTTSLSFTFKGAYKTLTYNDIYDCRLLGGGKWNTPTSTTTMKPMRFYLKIASRGNEQVLPASSSATPIRMTVWGEDGETTDIDDLQIADSEPANQTIFDMQGRPVEQPESGMYIINGKKVIVK